jgi:hypothetical protein
MMCSDTAAISGRMHGHLDVQGSRKPEFRSVPIQLSGKSSATPTSAQSPDTQITTGATPGALPDELTAGACRSSSPGVLKTSGSMAGAGLPPLATVDPSGAPVPRMPSNTAQSPPQQDQHPATLTQTSARHARELQQAAQQRVLALVQAQAQARANDAAAGLDMLSLTTPTSGELLLDGRLATHSQPHQGALTHPSKSGLSNSGRDIPVVADGRARTTSGQLCAHLTGIQGSGNVDALLASDSARNNRVSPGGRIDSPLAMHGFDNDPFADHWDLGQAHIASDNRNHHPRSVSDSRAGTHGGGGLAGMMQTPKTIHRPRVEPYRSGPAAEQARLLSPSPQARRLRHVMEEGVHTTSDRDDRGASKANAIVGERSSSTSAHSATERVAAVCGAEGVC